MSHGYYNNQWMKAQDQLKNVLSFESHSIKPEMDKNILFHSIATLYITYIQIFTKLNECHDQIVHPQKRILLKHMLEGTMGRILDLKQDMVRLELSEYHFMDDILCDMKLTPDQIELPIPKYFIRERQEEIQNRNNVLDKILLKIGPKKIQDKFEVELSIEEAVKIIQTNERARQARIRALFMVEIKKQEIQEFKTKAKEKTLFSFTQAAEIIQKIWRGCITRRFINQEKYKESVFLGMTEEEAVATEQKRAAAVEELRRTMQESNQQKYEEALVNMKAILINSEGPELKENMQNNIRQWFIEVRDSVGRFPDYPSVEEGGSLKIFTTNSPDVVEEQLNNKPEKGKAPKKPKENKKEKNDKKAKPKKNDEFFELSESKFMNTLKETSEEYEEVWKLRNEEHNFHQKYDIDLIKGAKRREMEEEIRLQVDELMREELKNLKEAVDRQKTAKKKGKKAKKRKKGGKKGRKGKDMTANRDMAELYEELVVQGIIKKPESVRVGDYIGDYNYLGMTLRKTNVEPMPSPMDVRRLVTEFAILPLGSAAVHASAPLVKSMMLTGPRGVGKKMLVHAICNELGANLFDLTATNIAGKYPGKNGLKMLMHLVDKVGRALQPSVIFIDECEKMFKKKIPKTDTTDPKRIRKDLIKLCKGIKGPDRVIVIGTSTCPWEAEVKGLTGFYQKLILIPRPDFPSRKLLWRHAILKLNGKITRLLDLCLLSKVSDGYSPANIIKACEQVLSESRITQLHRKPLKAHEFIEPLSTTEPIYKEEEDMFKDWHKKTPLGKKRQKINSEKE